MDRKLDLATDFGEAFADRLRLQTSESYGRIFQCVLNRPPNTEVMRDARHRMRGVNFGRRTACIKDVRGTHYRGTAATWVIRRPEAVRREDEMKAEHVVQCTSATYIVK